MERWTRFVLAHRWPVLAVWLVVLLAGGYGFLHLSKLTSNEFSVPGTESERARTILQDHFGDRSDGDFTVVFKVPAGSASRLLPSLESRVARAAHAVPTGHAT